MKNCLKLITTSVVILINSIVVLGSTKAFAQSSPTDPNPVKIMIRLDSGGSSQASGPVAGMPSQAFVGQTGRMMTATVLAAGGRPAYHWSLVSGQLPPGMHNVGSQFTWTPSEAGTWKSIIEVTDSGFPVRSTKEALVVSATAPPLAIRTLTLSAAQNGKSYTANLQAQGGNPAYSWTLVTGSLPQGLALSNGGAITGTPTSSGRSAFTVEVQDQASPSHTARHNLSLQVKAGALGISSATLTSGQTNSAYTAMLQATGGLPTYNWSIVSGSLPAGISLTSNGALSGTPTTSGTSNFTVSVADGESPAQVRTASLSIAITAAAAPLNSHVWYVRPDGGTRYSVNQTSGQCNGNGDAAYSGSGVNQDCAFKDVRYLWQDGSYANGQSFPAWGWIGIGGDTYIIRGSIADGVSYRVGYEQGTGPYCFATGCFGIAGSPGASGAPVPLSGTALQHTQILGGNYGNCHDQNARTQLHGGFATGSVLDMTGASYVDVQCLDITDQSACGRASNNVTCSHDTPVDDYANVGITWSRTSTNDTMTDIRVHGLASTGLAGPTGDGVVLSYFDIVGNAGSGWNADPLDGTTGIGHLMVQNYSIKWNGCLEEYPIVDAVPYHDCTDQSSGGYGDGFGTATVASQAPGWQVVFDKGEVAYNTQDGLDALHLTGPGSTMTVTRTLAYGNMGNQLKVGGAQGILIGNIVVGNCNAMSLPIPGTPVGYNTKLSTFCRGGDAAVDIAIGHGTTSVMQHNTIIANSLILTAVICDTSTGFCDSTAHLDYRDNLEVGNYNTDRNVNPSGLYLSVEDDTYTTAATCNAAPNHFWQTDGFTGCQNDPMASPGSIRDHNVVLNAKEGCPAQYETNVTCGSPGLVSEVMPAFGFPDVSPLGANSLVYQSGVALPGVTTDYAGNAFGSTPTAGALELGSTVTRYF